MNENQNIEYKKSWHNDYLKTICAFANSNGGKLFIGMDDSGSIVGISAHKKLMEDLPNKIKNHLGITAEIILHKIKLKYYLEIIVKPYSVAISLRSRYYIRVGSTTTEIAGNSLNDFLLKNSGKTWDDYVEDRAVIEDIDEKSLSRFIAVAEKSNRLPDVIGLTTFEILEKLRLTEGNKLKRAAIILFGKDPGKFYPNIYVKIGRFGKSDDDLLYQEVEEGNLFQLLQNVLLQLNRKFFKNPIEFVGIQRIEKGEYPAAAVREMLLNALVHKNYLGSTIQIRLYDEKFNIWNEGRLPPELDLEMLKKQHPSIPRNPIIADVCYKGGFIDTWGRGIPKIINTCNEANLPAPIFKEISGGFFVELQLSKEKSSGISSGIGSGISSGIGSGKTFEKSSDKIFNLIKNNPKITIPELSNILGISERAIQKQLAALKREKRIERIGATRGYWKIIVSD